jgi:hypothetical protein
MGYNFEKGRGKFDKNIELKYIQLPHEVYEIIFRDYSNLPEQSRMLALWHFTYHFFTNSGYETLKLKDMNAYMLCTILDSKLGQLQNIARWRCFDEFYKGEEDIDYEMALELYNKEKKEKKKELNKKDYQRRKNIDSKTFEELKAAREKEVNEIIKRHLEES